MSKEVGIVVIHGIGSQQPSFADEMIEEITGRVEDRRKDPDKIAWGAIYWADLLQERQSGYFKAATRQGDLDYVKLRKFVIAAFGDAVAYQKVTSRANSTYARIHGRVRESIRELYEVDLNGSDKPLIVIAHSLGGHIMSNYIWDTQHLSRDEQRGLSRFETMKTLTGIITFGCNIPLFTFAYSKVVPIEFPPRSLPSPLKRKAKWLNFYDPDDVLAYPLKAINPAYRKVVSRDLPINVGGLFSSWNPLSHTRYWTDNDFTGPVSRFIAGLL